MIAIQQIFHLFFPQFEKILNIEFQTSKKSFFKFKLKYNLKNSIKFKTF